MKEKGNRDPDSCGVSNKDDTDGEREEEGEEKEKRERGVKKQTRVGHAIATPPL